MSIVESYTTTEDISEATAWVSYEDNVSPVKEFIIPNKMYKLIKQIDPFTEEEEYFIESEDGYLSMYYLSHAGAFIKPKYN